MTQEDNYWADKAALLDPDCYNYIDGLGLSVTVPPDKVYYLLNAWGTRFEDTDFMWHHRELSDPVMLPPGFVIRTASYPGGYGLAYYADPSLVQTDQRYIYDPKGLYYERLNRLRSIPMEHVDVYIYKGGPPLNDTYIYNAFPVDCERIMLKHVNCHDGSWVVLCTEDVKRPMNTKDELDDCRPLRSTGSMMTPILRSVHPGIRLGFGNCDGLGPTVGPQTYHGWGSVMFQRLPSDW